VSKVLLLIVGIFISLALLFFVYKSQSNSNIPKSQSIEPGNTTESASESVETSLEKYFQYSEIVESDTTNEKFIVDEKEGNEEFCMIGDQSVLEGTVTSQGTCVVEPSE
jgi:capsular polysaccharide biosynthesis protein